MGIFLQLNETLEWTDERGEEGKGASNIAVVRLVVALVEEEEEEIVSYCSGDGEREREGHEMAEKRLSPVFRYFCSSGRGSISHPMYGLRQKVKKKTGKN